MTHILHKKMDDVVAENFCKITANKQKKLELVLFRADLL
jgi:hypothetical protein